MSENVLLQVRVQLTDHRTLLVGEQRRIASEIERLTRELQEVDAAVGGIDQVLGTAKAENTRRRPTDSPAPSPADEKQQLRDAIAKRLTAAYPSGLTSVDLQAWIIADGWSYGDLSARRIGTIAARMTEVVGDGACWYFVPVEKSPTEQREANPA